MAGFSIEELSDLMEVTAAADNRGKWTQIATALTDYIAARQLLKKKRRQITSGDIITNQIVTGTLGAAKAVKLFEQDNVNIGDMNKHSTLPWRFLQTDYAIELREVSTNRNPNKIVDLMEIRRKMGIIDMLELIESIFWGIQGADDERTPFSVTYWLLWNATPGFTGANHPSFSGGPGGLSSTTYTGWKNYSATYAATTKADLIEAWKKAFMLTRWRNPVSIPDGTSGDFSRRANYVNYDTWAAISKIGEDQNESLGKDLASMDDQMLFHGTPITWVHQLDSTYATSDPIFMIDWDVLFPVIQTGWYMKESGPQVPNMHNVSQRFIDLTVNLQCTNRRKMAVIAKADPLNG